MRVALRALLLALLVTTAGCSALFGGDDTPARTTTAGTDRATTVAVGPPPGLTTDGVADASILVRTHAGVLANRSVTLRERRVRRNADGSLRQRRNLTVWSAANRTRFLIDSDVVGREVYGASEGRVVTFADGEGIYRYVETPNRSWADTLRTTTGDPETPRNIGLTTARTDDLYVALSAFAVNDSASVRRSVEDPRRYRVESSTVVRPDLLASRLDLGELRNATLTAVVTAEGLIAEYRLTFAGTYLGGVVRGEVSLRYSAVGETRVRTPAWYDEAAEQTVTNLTATAEG